MINGIDVISFPVKTKSEDFCNFLIKVRDYNPIGRICLILDNFSTHKAKKVQEKAKALNIMLVYLPPYSPDLNPIEYIWKSIKRAVSISDVDNVDDLIKIVENNFFSLTGSLSFAKSWIPRFLHDKLHLLC